MGIGRTIQIFMQQNSVLGFSCDLQTNPKCCHPPQNAPSVGKQFLDGVEQELKDFNSSYPPSLPQVIPTALNH